MDTSSPLPSGSDNAEADRIENWLGSNTDLVRRDQSVLDVACGRGRHALWLAQQGWDVHAVDRDADALAALNDRARAVGVTVHTTELDLEADAVDLGSGRYGTIVVFRYLHRPLFPALVRALLPGGCLIYQTFIIGQQDRGGPHNPAFLLRPGELVRLVAPLEVVRSREGDFEGALVASVAARKKLP